MDDDIKKKIITDAVVPMLVPVARIGVNNHFADKQMKKRQKHEVRMAAYQNDVIDGEKEADPSEYFGENDDGWLDFAGGREDDGEDDPDPSETLEEAIDVAEDLESTLDTAHENEQCSFCRDVIQELKGKPLHVQREGLRELREVQDVMYGDATAEEIEATMDSMELVPQLYMESAEDDSESRGKQRV